MKPGRIISIKDADVNIEMGFLRETVEKATEETEPMPPDIAMMRIEFLLTQPGASSVEITVGSEEQYGTCIHLTSRKISKPTVINYDQHRLFRADGNKHITLFNDLSIGDSSSPPPHYIGIKVVKCAKDNTTHELVMTSPVVDGVDPLNVTFTTRVHSCTYWDTAETKWSGKGCKVRSVSKLWTVQYQAKHDLVHVSASSNIESVPSCVNNNIIILCICIASFP